MYRFNVPICLECISYLFVEKGNDSFHLILTSIVRNVPVPFYHCSLQYSGTVNIFLLASLFSWLGSSGDIGCFSRKYTVGTRCWKCCGSGMFVTDPGFEFFHPGSTVKKIADSVSHRKDFLSFPDPDPGSRGKKKHRIPDLQHCLLVNRLPDDCLVELNLDE
jgi:hypothetical protein